MEQRLVMWGEIGTDRKALIALNLDEPKAKVHIYAFPKEDVSKEIQDKLFVEWKNGGDFEFPTTAIHWEIDANQDNILPENVKVERPDLVIQHQAKWGKKLMSERVNQLLSEETNLIVQSAENATQYDQSIWDKAKTQWEKIASHQKKNEITWEQTSLLKEKINSIFDALKAIKRISDESEDKNAQSIIKGIDKKIEDLQARLIYADQWKGIFNELKNIQEDLKNANMKWQHKRKLYDKVNSVFEDLRKYRSTEIIQNTKNRITQLNNILDGLKDSIARDTDNYNMQIEKMNHYTRGKLSAEEIKTRFGYILERTTEKEKKANGIVQTIAELKKEIEKEQQDQAKRIEEAKQKVLLAEKQQQEFDEKQQNKAAKKEIESTKTTEQNIIKEKTQESINIPTTEEKESEVEILKEEKIIKVEIEKEEIIAEIKEEETTTIIPE